MTRWAREHDFDALIDAQAGTYHVDSDLVRGLIGHESQFDPQAVGDDGSSFGLMQVQQTTARSVGVYGDLLDPANNIRAGVAYLAQQIATAGDVPSGLSAYNGGYRPELGFGRRLPTGLFRNQAYVDTVLNNTRYFQSTAVFTVKPAKPDTALADLGSEPLTVTPGKVGLVALVTVAVLAGLWALLH